MSRTRQSNRLRYDTPTYYVQYEAVPDLSVPPTEGSVSHINRFTMIPRYYDRRTGLEIPDPNKLPEDVEREDIEVLIPDPTIKR